MDMVSAMRQQINMLDEMDNLASSYKMLITMGIAKIANVTAN